MRFRLNQQHYADDRLLEAGQEVGDGEASVHPWRHAIDHADRGIKAGQAYPPSKEMTPLDGEAKKMLDDAFGAEAPKPGAPAPKNIPIQGTGNVGVTKAGAPRPALPAHTPTRSAPAPTQAAFDKKEPEKK